MPPKRTAGRAANGTTAARGRHAAEERPNKKVGYVFDARMKYHQFLPEAHQPNETHPEDPRRIYWIYEILQRSGLLSTMTRVSSRMATDAELLRAHTEKHIDFMQDTETMERPNLLAEAASLADSDVYLCRESNYCGKLSAGALLVLCKEVALGNLHSGIGIIRPPGHHACRDRPMGFCLFNNVSVAVHDLLFCHLANKVMVVDWDVHHGNGIQEAFYDNRDVLYVSLHRYDGEEFYPQSDEGKMEMVGGKGAEGFNINIPWPCQDIGDGDYLDAFRRVVIPVAREFSPDIIIVASGFDAAVCDPIGLCKVTPQGYATMTSMLRAVSNNKLVLALEGGYNLDAIANSMLGCAKALMDIRWDAGVVPQVATRCDYATLSEEEINGVLMGKKHYNASWKCKGTWDPETEVPECFNSEPSDIGKSVVDGVLATHRKYWRSLDV